MKLLKFFKKLKQINNFFPIVKYQIEENSMIPAFKPGDLVLVNKLSFLLKKPKIGDIIIFQDSQGKYLIKRIEKISNNIIFVLGINKKKSIDSRRFGSILKKDIIGRVLFKI